MIRIILMYVKFLQMLLQNIYFMMHLGEFIKLWEK